MLAHQELLRHAEDKKVVARMTKRDQQSRIGATIGPEAVPVRLSPSKVRRADRPPNTHSDRIAPNAAGPVNGFDSGPASLISSELPGERVDENLDASNNRQILWGEHEYLYPTCAFGTLWNTAMLS